MHRLLAILLPLLSATPQPAMAQVAVADSGDTAWMMLCGLLVLLAALPGLALRHAGLVHVRTALSIGVQGVAVAAGVSLLWGLVGYSLAYAPGRSEEHKSELQSLIRMSYDVFCMKQQTTET